MYHCNCPEFPLFKNSNEKYIGPSKEQKDIPLMINGRALETKNIYPIDFSCLQVNDDKRLWFPNTTFFVLESFHVSENLK